LPQPYWLVSSFYLIINQSTGYESFRNRGFGKQKSLLIAASILVKGKRTGTKTDNNGSFTITAARGDVLIISAIGYATRQVTVTGSTMNVALLTSQGGSIGRSFHYNCNGY